jgi:hypothetical protein
MRKELFLVAAGSVLFNIIFWQEKLAVNALFFDAFIIGAVFYLYPDSKSKTIARWLLLAHVVSVCMLVLHNTSVSKIAFSVTLVLFASFAEYVHRSPWYAGGSFLLNATLFPASFVEKLNGLKVKKRKGGVLSKVIRFSIFPVLLVIVFFFIYRISNSIFSQLAYEFSLQAERFFASFFSWFSVARWLFLAAGFYVVGSMLLKSRVNYFGEKEAMCKDELVRKRKTLAQRKAEVMYEIVAGIMGKFGHGIMALKNENTVGIISLFLLNLLLLIVNTIDISFIWINFEFSRNSNIYKMVHEGTELLIISIVLAMLVLIFFFKGNLNFYKKNKWLKLGAYAWIFQNIILVISVFLRDYYYIVFFGLAYKRIGVLFFLLAVLTGLTTVFLKIRYKKSNYFLFRVNAWAGIFMLVVATTINWDQMIASYNFRNNDKVPVDLDFIFTLSDQALPVIDRHKDILLERDNLMHPEKGTVQGPCRTCYTERLIERKQSFLKDQQTYSWLSWNYADASVKKYLRNSEGNNVSQIKTH